MSNKQNIKRISFSELKHWKECPYRHKLIYKDNLSSFSGNEYTAFGQAIHYVCENIVPSSNDKNSLELFHNYFNSKLEELNIDSDSQLVTEMKQQAVPICTNVLPELKKTFGTFKVISVEEELLEDITEFESFGKKFKGFIDLVIKTSDQKYHIIDWKTCSWGWDSSKKTDPITTYQLTFYKNYFAKKHNIPASNIETYFALLKRTAKKENVEFFRVTSGHKKTENSLKVLQNAVINIEKEIHIKNRLNCKYCEFYKSEHCV